MRPWAIAQVCDGIAGDTVSTALQQHALGLEPLQVALNSIPNLKKQRVVGTGWHRHVELGTPRVTDAAVVIGPAAWKFNWARNDYDALVNPDIVEFYDTKDNECDGLVDEGFIPAGAVIVADIEVPSGLPYSVVATWPNARKRRPTTWSGWRRRRWPRWITARVSSTLPRPG